jgi:RNA polymerase sigma-70 factor, ECF subfamily
LSIIENTQVRDSVIKVINKIDSATDLVSRIRAGDQQAQAELVERYSQGVQVILRREISNTTIVEDLYQETFRIVLEKIRQGDVREPERLSGFVRGVARNLIIEHFRRATRLAKEANVDAAEPLPHPAPDQFEELLLKEKSDLIRQIFKVMSNKRDIQVLLRYYLAEEDKERICADLGLTRRYFNVVLQRARERFRELYEQALGDK